jgi:hypothetical protein
MAMLDSSLSGNLFPANPFVPNPFLALIEGADRPCVAPPFAGGSLPVIEATTREDQVALRDRLILALAAQLQAERDTRELVARMIAAGPVDPQVLLAVLGDPIPAQNGAGQDGDATAASRRSVRAGR